MKTKHFITSCKIDILKQRHSATNTFKLYLPCENTLASIVIITQYCYEGSTLLYRGCSSITCLYLKALSRVLLFICSNYRTILVVDSSLRLRALKKSKSFSVFPSTLEKRWVFFSITYYFLVTLLYTSTSIAIIVHTILYFEFCYIYALFTSCYESQHCTPTQGVSIGLVG